MLTLHSEYCQRKNWTINLCIVLCFSNITTTVNCKVKINDTKYKLPSNWPSQWNDGIIPYVFDFFALSPRRLISLVKKAHTYIEERSCLIFEEVNPVECIKDANYTYLFYTYSEVLESCCLRFYTKNIGRRLVLITPTCSLQVEVAHATLHALGLEHTKSEPFTDNEARAVMYPVRCQDMSYKLAALEGDVVL